MPRRDINVLPRRKLRSVRDRQTSRGYRRLGPAVASLLAGACLLVCTAAPAAARGAGAPTAGQTAADKIVTQEKRRQDALVDQELKSAGRDVGALLAGLGRVVEGYRRAMLSQGSALSHYLYGRILFKLADLEMQARPRQADRRKVDTAIGEMKAALGRDARLWQAQFALAFIHGRAGDVDRMEASLATLLRTHGERPEVIGLYAQLLFQRRRFKELKPAAEKLLRLNPENLGARELLAKAYMGMKDWGHAEQTVRTIIARSAANRGAYLMLLDCLLGQQKYDEAERQAVALIQRAPKDVSLRLVYVNVLLTRGNRKRAIEVMRQVTAAYPKHVGYLGRLADIYREGKDYKHAEAVLNEARALCETGDEQTRAMKPYIMTNLALVLYRAKRYEALVQVVEELDRDLKVQNKNKDADPLPPQLLDFLQNAYGNLGRKEDLIRTLKRILPHLRGRPDDRKNLEAQIKLLESGEGVKGGAVWSRDRVAELIEAIGSPDVKTRRDALFRYYEADLPFVDPIVYKRYDGRVEPDPECRLWVVKILSRFTVADANPEVVRLATRYVALTLEDRDQDVRRAASQGLQKIASAAALIYLIPYLPQIQLEGGGLTASSRKANEREYNAARAALKSLTAREDTPLGTPTWVPFDRAAAHRAEWLTWYDSPQATSARLKALDDLDADEQFGPRWHLRYLLPDLIKQAVPVGGGKKRGTMPPTVFLRSYRLLKRHVLLFKQKTPAKFTADTWFPSFPIYADADLKAANVTAIRKALLGWWEGLEKSGARKKVARRGAKRGAR